MQMSRLTLGAGAPNPERVAEEEQLRRAIHALDLDARRASLDTGRGLRGDELMRLIREDLGLTAGPTPL